MEYEKRKGERPLPEDIKEYLTTDQIHGLRNIEGFGWELKFIRRPLFQEVVAVAADPLGAHMGILEMDGRLNLDSDIPIR